MSDLRTIGTLASTAGVPTSTVRFYERRGLLPADSRSPAGYRLYGDAALERLLFIRAAQNSGFRLDDIAALLELREERGIPREEVRAMLTDRLAEVRRRVSELRVLERALKRSLDACSQGGEGECCPVMHEISVTAAGRNKKTQ